MRLETGDIVTASPVLPEDTFKEFVGTVVTVNANEQYADVVDQDNDVWSVDFTGLKLEG
tara:strand:- start:1670 stop:1846 length:177 start_codon:yes stop_codon:yes gene_type:complete